jgi:pimeloyl-ACP methyl ester carboxylesterase
MKMKYRTKFIRIFFVIIFLTSFTSCHNLFKDDKEKPEVIYLVNYEMIGSYSQGVIQTIFKQLEGSFPEASEISARARHGVIIYKIIYKTTFQGKSVLASGLVSVPAGEGPYDQISYQNGTNTLHRNAPSKSPERDLYRLIQTVASTGFVISLPDYLGFGESENMFHPYLHKASTVQSVLDMLRAVGELSELRGFGLTNDLYLTGYSMGGWATLQIQYEIENNFRNEFNLKASAPAAGPYDLTFINKYILEQETYAMPYFLGFMMNSYLQLEEMTTPVSEIFEAPYDSVIPVLFTGDKTGEELNARLTINMSELFTENYRLNYATDTTFSSLMNMLEVNSVEPWNISTPTMLIHSTGDELVPYAVTQKTRSDLLLAGTPANRIELVPMPEYSHSEGIIPAGLISINWFLELTK